MNFGLVLKVVAPLGLAFFLFFFGWFGVLGFEHIVALLVCFFNGISLDAVGVEFMIGRVHFIDS